VLMRRWERARRGEGQLVLIVGEPGLGKSRLIEEFHLRLRETPHTWSEWTCSQLLQNTPLHPIAEWGRQRFGGADIPAERRLVDLENSLTQVKLDPAENASLLAPLLDIPLLKERAPTLAPEELRRRQLAALNNWVMASAKTQPLVLAFEDLHWADPTTLDVLRGLAERGASVPLYIVATARPEFRPPWGMRSHHGTISLAPLDRAQVRDMVGELSARHALSHEVVDDVAARTGGVPLFVEEVTRLLLERGEQGGAQAIPPTLQQSLMARLDRLGPAREVAQIGSVIGRGFSYKLLKAVSGMDDAPLEAALEKLSDADIVLVEGVLPESEYRFKHALIQDAAYENLLKSRRQVLHRRIAETLRDRFADRAAAEPEVLAHHFTQAGLTDPAIEWWGKAGDQALRRSAFQEAIAHLGKAIEMADKADEAAPRATAATSAASPTQRLKLQTSYGLAVMWSKGYGAEETKAAFARARDLGAVTGNFAERSAANYGYWANSHMRGEFTLARETAEIFLREAESEGRIPESSTGHRILGLTCLLQGDLIASRVHLEEALRIYDPEWDLDDKFRLSLEPRLAAMAYLAEAEWILGDVERARHLIHESVAGSIEAAHVPTLANSYSVRARYETFRGDVGAALQAAKTSLEYSQEHRLGHYVPMAMGHVGWARARLGESEAGLLEMRRALAAHTEHGNKAWVPLVLGLIADIEAVVELPEAASARIDEALAIARQTGEHWTDSLLHRIHGEILLKRDPANTAPAEEAYLTAIAVAQQQKARSFQLQAAVSLAKHYQSTGRSVDAHVVLAPALEGFSPTPEFPEIEQAQTLLAALAETYDVKNAAASRQRRLKLHTSYSQAVMWSKGFGAEETRAALARARELADGVGTAGERYATYYGLWANTAMQGDFASALDIAESFLREAHREDRQPEVSAAQRMVGFILLRQGDFIRAREHLEEAVKIYGAQRRRDSMLPVGVEAGPSAMANLAMAKWILGDITQATREMNEAVSQALNAGHVPTLANCRARNAELEILCGRADTVLHAAESLFTVSRDHEFGHYLPLATVYLGWARARLGQRNTGLLEMRQGLTTHIASGNKAWTPFFQGLLADVEAEDESVEGVLARLDEALALANETGEHWTDTLFHRVRAKILLKRDPTNPTPTEEAFRAAIAIAQQQKAKSFELQTALPLAKLYRSTGRAADAHAVLARALEGFSPTPEFPEIAQAQALLAAPPS
jgi:predicted ATPase